MNPAHEKKGSQTMPNGGLLLPRPADDARVISGTLAVRNLSYVVTDEMDFITNSVDWVNVPAMSVNFRLLRGSDILAFFSAISATLEPDSIVVRTRLDEGTISFPEEIQFSGMLPDEVRDWAGDCHSYPFVFQNVAPGPHIVTAEFRSVQPGEQVIISRPSLVVAYE